jgi:NAD(P)-dependent dehydrogenase (short-subunit alcohol dehydrogenase family)
MDSGQNCSGQVAVVTGAGRGIGRAVAVALAEAGADVALVARSPEQVLTTAELVRAAGREALALPADVTDQSAVEDAIGLTLDRFGAIDLLVNNAGANGVFGPLWESPPEQWWRDVTVNLYGPFLCCAAVLRSMIDRGSGRIVNIVSGTAGRPFPYNSAYAASKAALVRLTDCLAAETAEHSVSVFALGPGTIRTDISLGLERSELGRKWLGTAIDQLRFIDPEVPAGAVVFLASGAADELSGRWLDAADDLPVLVSHAATVRTDDLFQLRRSKLPVPG